MNMIEYLGEIEKAMETILLRDRNKIKEITTVLKGAKERESTVFVFGNGGSSSTAAHFVCDLVKACRIKAVCLSDNTPYFSAYANDISYESVFVSPLSLLMRNGDVAIGLSCSGNSANVLRAFEFINSARYKGIYENVTTIGFTGFKGGKLRDLVDIHINVPVNSYRISEDVHLMLCHLIVELLVGDNE